MPVRSTEYLSPAIAADQNDQDIHERKRLRQLHCDTHQSRLDLRFRINELVFIGNRQCIIVLPDHTGYQCLMPLRHTFFAQVVRRSGVLLMIIPETQSLLCTVISLEQLETAGTTKPRYSPKKPSALLVSMSSVVPILAHLPTRDGLSSSAAEILGERHHLRT